MAKLARSDLKFDYEWSASSDDNSKQIHDDANHLNHNNGYEMMRFLNELGVAEGKVVYGYGNEFTRGALLRIEWMLRERFKSKAPSTEIITQWINENWEKHRGTFSSLHSGE